MSKTNTAILLADVYSTFKKGYQYGSKGDKVQVVAEYGTVKIVQLKTERFSVTDDKLLTN